MKHYAMKRPDGYAAYFLTVSDDADPQPPVGLTLAPLDGAPPACPGDGYEFNCQTLVWELTSTAEQLVAAQWVRVRNRRNALLSACDWTQLPDVPQATRDAWAGYRQALRDVTQQADPGSIVWPVVPA